jgi:methionyl-tRNA formyltransferase
MPLRLVFMGTPAFALPALQALSDSPHTIAAVYTAPPRPAGRGQRETLTPVHAFAQSRGLSVMTPLSLKSPEAQATFTALAPDVAIVAAYGLLLPPAILETPRHGCLNIHPSLLPRWRGAAPIQRAVMAGDTETGIVIMQMNAGLDTGDMLLTERYPVMEDKDAGALQDDLANASASLLLRALDLLEAGRLEAMPQPEEGVTYAAKIVKAECALDWRRSARELRQKILGLSPQPGAFFHHAGETIKLLAAEIVSQPAPLAQPGTVLDAHFSIQCGQDALKPLLLQRAGKKPMPTEAFLRGYAVAVGSMLCEAC